MLRVALLVIISFFFSEARSIALDPTYHLSQYGHNYWRVQDGYLGGDVEAITQTGDGYLWVGTSGGLYRFDGIQFASWISISSQPLPSKFINGLIGARDGSLWVATNAGLAHWMNRQLVTYASGLWVVGPMEDAAGNIWFVERSPTLNIEKPLCEITDGVIRCYGKEDGFVPTESVSSPIQDKNGDYWMWDSQGLIRWRPHGVSKRYRLKPQGGAPPVTGIPLSGVARLRDGSIVASVFSRNPHADFERMSGNEFKPWRVTSSTRDMFQPISIYQDSTNSLWLATWGHGIYRVRDSTVEHYQAIDGLTSDFVSRFFEDRERNIWVLTSAGIDIFRDLRVTTYSTHEGLSSDGVFSVTASRDGNVWVGTNSALEVLGRDGTFHSISKSLNMATALLVDHAGRTWVGMTKNDEENLFVRQNQSLTRVARQNGHAVGSVLSLAEDGENNIWALLGPPPHTLVRIRDFQVQEEFRSPPMPVGDKLLGDVKDGVWIGLRNGNLARLRGGKFELVQYGNHPSSRVAQLIRGPNGAVLGATDFGVVGWKDGRQEILDEHNGLPCNSVHLLLIDAEGNFWLHTQCGLVEISQHELQHWWRDPDAKLEMRILDAADGFEAEQSSYGASARSHDGRLWFAIGPALQMVDPSRLTVNNVVPLVHVTAMVADKKKYGSEDGIKLPPRSRDVEIDFTAPSFAVPQKVLFRYMLEGRDSEWQEPVPRRQAFYNDLGPGYYHFRVAACNSDGVWSPAEASLEFSILPAYYQSNWFRVLCGIAFLALLWGLYQLRVQKMQREFNVALERARLYEGLKTRDDKIRRLVDSNIIGIFIIDFEGQIIEANYAFLRMVGYEREDLVSGRMSWKDLTPPEWREADARRLETVKRIGTLQPFEKEYFRKNGTRVPVLVGVARFEEEKNHAVVFALDMSEQKRVEGALRRSETDLYEAQRLSHTGSWKLDVASGRVIVSPEIYQIFDAKPDEDVSKPEFWFGRIHPEDRARVREHFERCVADKLNYEENYRIVLPDSTIRYQHSIGRPVVNESGTLMEFLGTAVDTTEQVRARLKLESAFEEIKQLKDHLFEENVALKEEIADAARMTERTRIARELHDTLLQDFQASLTQMQAARNLFSRKPEKAVQTLDDAIDAAAGAIDTGRDAIQGLRSGPMAKADLGEMLTATSQDLMKSGSGQPTFDLIEEGERRMLSPAIKDEIGRIALEILRNAYRHAQAHRIEAEVRYEENMLRLRIRDDGKGMDPKVLQGDGIAGHFGLRGMRERAERIGATLEFWTETGAGTETQLAVPGSIAYENSREPSAKFAS